MESTYTNELPSLSKSAVMDRNDDSGLASQFLQSAAYAGLEAPARALAQVADHYTGGHADASVQSEFKSMGVEPQKAAEFGTSKWVAQQVGSAAGMMLPFLALRGGVKYTAGKVLGEEAVAGTLEAGSQTLARTAMREAALSGSSGLLYGSLLSPSNESHVGSSSFYTDRLKNGLSDMANFAALSMVSPFVGKGLDSAASAAESNKLLPSLARTSVSAALRNPIVNGMLSGIPSGLVNAEAGALSNGHLLASSDELKQGIGGMVAIGGALGAASWAMDRAGQQASTATAQQHEAAAREAEQTGSAEQLAAPRRQMQQAQIAEQNPGSSGRQSEAQLAELVNQAVQKMAQQGKTDSVPGPEESLLDSMAKSTIRRNSFVSSRSVEDEAAKADTTKPVNPNPAGAGDNLPGLEIVLGASGAETPAHAGFLQAVEDNHVPVGRITGVSGGSLVATLYANHYTPTQIKDILLSDGFRHPSLSMLAKCFHVTDPWNLYPYAMDFRPWLQDFVDKYHLKPQPNLRIVAADEKTRQPIIFQGTNYDLATALTASTAATPALGLKPVEVDGRTAIDGFFYHPIPAMLSKPPAIVSKIGFVRELPSEPLAPWDYFMHLREMAYYNEFKDKYPDPQGHIISETGLPDVATTTFGLSDDTMEKLIEHGYDATNERLHAPDAVKAIKEAQKEVATAAKTRK